MPVVPLITTIIPCHNHARWVQDALTSVLSQKGPFVHRVVLVDDGSTDRSHEAALAVLDTVYETSQVVGPKTWIGHVPDVSVLVYRFETASGPAFARNAGVRAGWEGTDLFAFLDSDDIYRPGKLARSLAVWQDSPEHVGAVYTDYDTWNEATGLKVRQYKEPFSRRRLIAECLPNMDSLVSKAALQRCGLFDESFRTCEDYDLWMRISERFIITHVPESLVTIRVGDHSSTARVAKEVWNTNWRRVMEKAQARMRGEV